jgi:hypothetical protein
MIDLGTLMMITIDYELKLLRFRTSLEVCKVN